MIGESTPDALAARFTGVAHMWVPDGPGERTERARRQLLAAIAQNEPATLNAVAKSVGRGAPAVSRSVDTLVRSGLVERMQDPAHRRRLALRLTQDGRERLSKRTAGNAGLRAKLERLANSELRAVERAIEILERGL
jgi:DNA-binding MarR family transcriptional regulator